MSQLGDITGPQYFGTSKKKSCFEEGDKTLPGPGAHSPNKPCKINAPQWKIGDCTNRHSFLDPHRAKIPSPLHYKVDHHVVEKISKKMSIPQSTYELKPNNDNLKNCYEVNHSFTRTTYPQFSFGYSKQPDYTTLPPGPGAYQLPTKKISFNKTQSGFSTGERPTLYGEQAKFPGADKYQTITLGKSQKFSFGRSPRLSENGNNDPPAKFYDLQSKKTTIKLGRGRSTEYKRQPTFLPTNQYPAPSAYHNQQPHKILNGVIEASKRKPIQNLEAIQFPSADKYAPHKDIDKAKAQSFVKEDRHLQVVASQNIPGPGAYEAIQTLSKIGGAIPKKQQTDELREIFPGVATYRPKDTITRKKASSTLVLRSNRADFSKTLTGIIGPGQYNISGHLERELGKMSKSPRAEVNSPSKNPGVGNYNIPALIGQLPKYCTSPKKLTENGYSTFYEKMKMRTIQKQALQKANKIEKEVTQQQANYNPEEVKS